MNKNIKLSIIVPIYNIEKYVERCLISLKEQTLEELEILLIDDGSQDNSVYIVEEFIKTNNLKKFFIFHKSNGGLSDARNFGLLYAKGEYVTFLDGDDYIEPAFYETMYKKAKENNSTIVQCAYCLTYEDSEKNINIHEYKSLEEYAAYGNVVAWNKIYNREWLLKHKLSFPKGLNYEDIYFYYMCLFHLSSVNDLIVINKPFVHYVQRDGSIFNVQSKKLLDVLEIYDLIREKCPQSFKDSLEFRCSKNLNGVFFRKALKIKNKKDRKLVLKCYYNYLKTNYSCWRKNHFYKQSFKNFVIKYVVPFIYIFYK